jgi:hypothetical protein
MNKGFALGQVLSNDTRTVLFGQRDIDALRESGAQTVRLELRLGPNPAWDQPLIDRYEGIVSRLQDLGIDVIALAGHQIVASPRQVDWNANNVENGGTGNNPFLERFVAGAAQLVQAFNMISSWEIWNEPNAWSQHPSPTEYSGSTFIYPSLYARLLGNAVQAIKQVRTDASVMSGGVFCHNIGGNLTPDTAGANYLRAVSTMLDRASAKRLDAVGLHIYLDHGGKLNSKNVRTALKYVHQAMPGMDKKPLSITETGWQSPPLAPEVQASNLRTLFQECKDAKNVAAVCWFQIADNPAAKLYFGLCRADYSRKPAFADFARITTR